MGRKANVLEAALLVQAVRCCLAFPGLTSGSMSSHTPEITSVKLSNFQFPHPLLRPQQQLDLSANERAK